MKSPGKKPLPATCIRIISVILSRHISLIFILVFIVTVSVPFNEALCSANSADSRITLCFYDIDSSHPSSEERTKTIIEGLKLSNADIIILAGVKDQAELQDILKGLGDYPYSQLGTGKDSFGHIAFIARKAPQSFQIISGLKYVIKENIEIPVQKDFIHAVVKSDDYVLHILGADLKNREQHPVYPQTDMRRYEARLLRQQVNSIMKQQEDANIIILANLNDNCGSSPVKEIYNRRFGIKKRLFDLRPLDKMHVSWTYLSENRDEYERIDYAIVSSALIPEILFDNISIIDLRNWNQASSHRPIVLSILCFDNPLWTKEKIDTIFPNAIRTPEFIKIPPPIGEKKEGN